MNIEDRDLQRLLKVEAEMHNGPASPRQVLDVSTCSLIALAELLTLRERWRVERHVVELRGASVRPLLRAVREVIANQAEAVSDPGGATCGCLRVSVAQDQAFWDKQHRLLLGASAAMDRASYPTLARQRVLGAFGELIDNVFQHAGVCDWALAAYEVDDAGRFTASVMDRGEGVLAGYRRNAILGSGDRAADALDLAVLQHRSSTGRPDRGLGFKQLIDALSTLDAYVRVRSDDASITLSDETEGFGSRPRLAEEFRLAGFVVGFRIWHRA